MLELAPRGTAARPWKRFHGRDPTRLHDRRRPIHQRSRCRRFAQCAAMNPAGSITAANTAQAAHFPPSSSSIWTRMISSKLVSALKPSARRALRVEVARPAGDDLDDHRIGLAPDARRRPCRRRRGAAPRSARRPCTDRPGMVRLRRGPSCAVSIVAAWIRKPTAERGEACQWRTSSATGSTASCAGQRLADDVGEEARGRLVGLARPHADRRQADADAVEEAAPRIVGEQQLADRLLRAVAGQRRREELVADRSGKGAPKTAIDEVKTTRGL